MYRTQDYTADWTPAERGEYGSARPFDDDRPQPPLLRALVRETLTTLEGDGAPDDEILGALARHAADADAGRSGQLPVD